MEPKLMSVGLHSYIVNLKFDNVLIYADIPEINPCDTCIITVMCNEVCEPAAMFSWGSPDAEYEIFKLDGRATICNGSIPIIHHKATL